MIFRYVVRRNIRLGKISLKTAQYSIKDMTSFRFISLTFFDPVKSQRFIFHLQLLLFLVYMEIFERTSLYYLLFVRVSLLSNLKLLILKLGTVFS
jgi:hypothetical protein